MVGCSDINLEDNPEFIFNRSYVYVISDGEYIKIGKSSGNPAGRLSALQTGNARTLKLLMIISNPQYNGTIIEQRIHNYYKRQQIKNEWFSIDVLDDMILNSNPHKISNNEYFIHYRQLWIDDCPLLNMLLSKKIEISPIKGGKNATIKSR